MFMKRIRLGGGRLAIVLDKHLSSLNSEQDILLRGYVESTAIKVRVAKSLRRCSNLA